MLRDPMVFSICVLTAGMLALMIRRPSWRTAKA